MLERKRRRLFVFPVISHTLATRTLTSKITSPRRWEAVRWFNKLQLYIFSSRVIALGVWIQQAWRSSNLHQTLHLLLHWWPGSWCAALSLFRSLDARLRECSNWFGFDERRASDGQLRGGVAEYRDFNSVGTCHSIPSQRRNIAINRKLSSSIITLLHLFFAWRWCTSGTKIIMLYHNLVFCVVHELVYWFGKYFLFLSYQSKFIVCENNFIELFYRAGMAKGNSLFSRDSLGLDWKRRDCRFGFVMSIIFLTKFIQESFYVDRSRAARVILE